MRFSTCSFSSIEPIRVEILRFFLLFGFCWVIGIRVRIVEINQRGLNQNVNNLASWLRAQLINKEKPNIFRTSTTICVSLWRNLRVVLVHYDRTQEWFWFIMTEPRNGSVSLWQNPGMVLVHYERTQEWLWFVMTEPKNGSGSSFIAT